MSKPCIAIDVSQGKSHIQGFFGLQKPIGKKAKAMRHSTKGYYQILELIEIIKAKTNEVPLIIFEYTGIYHKTLEKFLLSNNLKFHIVAPLRAAKTRKTSLRDPKTDKRDCLSLAKMFYNDELGDFYLEDEQYRILKSLNRFYENLLLRQQEIKVNFREMLAIIYPNYKTGAFITVYSKESFAFLRKFNHPNKITSLSLDAFAKDLGEATGHKEAWCQAKAVSLMNYASEIVAGCDASSPEVNNLIFYINQIETYQKELDDTLSKMINMLQNNSLFKLVKTLPAIQDNLASRFVAEIGAISRFKNYKSIIAFTGTDPIIYQSGDNNGFHLRISKKGNKRLRSILYLMVIQMIKAKNIPSNIKDYYQKKTQLHLQKKVASIACVNKLIRIIYQLNKTGCTYKYNQ
jgi:transposase